MSTARSQTQTPRVPEGRLHALSSPVTQQARRSTHTLPPKRCLWVPWNLQPPPSGRGQATSPSESRMPRAWRVCPRLGPSRPGESQNWPRLSPWVLRERLTRAPGPQWQHGGHRVAAWAPGRPSAEGLLTACKTVMLSGNTGVHRQVPKSKHTGGLGSPRASWRLPERARAPPCPGPGPRVRRSGQGFSLPLTPSPPLGPRSASWGRKALGPLTRGHTTPRQAPPRPPCGLLRLWMGLGSSPAGRRSQGAASLGASWAEPPPGQEGRAPEQAAGGQTAPGDPLPETQRISCVALKGCG